MNERIPSTVVMDPIDPIAQSVRQAIEGSSAYVLPKANGGTGTPNPGLIAGTGVSISGEWPNQRIDTTAQATSAGDMTKAVYDPNGDGKVASADVADSVPWAGVSNKPTTFAPSAHMHSAADLTDTIPAARFGALTIPMAAMNATGTPSSSNFLRGDGTWATPETNGDMLKANNLSDLTNPATARTNLGLGSLATQSGTFSGTSSGTNTGDQTSVSGNAGTATKLATARTINGVAFDGTANITVPAAGSTLTDTVPVTKGGTGLAALGAALQVLRTNSAASGMEWVTLGGGGDMLKANNLSDLTNVATARTNLGLGSLATQSGTFSGTSSGTNTGDQTNIPGNAATATALQTARTINGVSFNGTANITVPAAGSTLTDTVPPSKGGTGLTTLGAALQVLRTNAAGTGTEWATVEASGGGSSEWVPRIVYSPRPLFQQGGGTNNGGNLEITCAGVSQACNITTGTDTNGRCRIWWNTAGGGVGATATAAIYTSGFRKMIDRFVVCLPAAPNATDDFLFECGLTCLNSTTAPMRDGAYIRITTAGIQGVLRNNNTESYVTSADSFADGAIVAFKIVYIPGVGATFYKDGVSFGTVTTNEPASTVPLHVTGSILKTAGTNSRTAYIGTRNCVLELE